MSTAHRRRAACSSKRTIGFSGGRDPAFRHRGRSSRHWQAVPMVAQNWLRDPFSENAACSDGNRRRSPCFLVAVRFDGAVAARCMVTTIAVEPQACNKLITAGASRGPGPCRPHRGC